MDAKSEYEEEEDEVPQQAPQPEQGDSEGDSNIRIFLRVKPSKRPSGFFAWDEDTSLMEYNIPKDVAAGLINNSRTSYKFRFNTVIGMEAKQAEVFDRVGRPCVESALNGFNATVFAYGQTGSGKTFTITGGAERYDDRGLIPRALSMIFEEMKKNPNRQILVHVSYLEIYNNQGYDLLDPNHESTKSLEDLPKVSMLEDEDGNCHLRNLSMHLVHAEEDALNLLFLGDTNRAVSETPMNLASSRSHCIFTVSLECRRTGSEVVLRSKLHLVDLAGSERAHKTGAKGQLLREATYINTSLHYLEMVIVALHEKNTKGRTHIPYRNSMLTSMLRDSLGGNCKTVMIATVSPEKEQTDESVSTCRFAQRVARVRNDARLNEEVDPQIIIRQLKAQVASLQEELAIARGDVKEGDELKDYELDKLRLRVQDFVNDPELTAHLNMGEFTYTKMKACFDILRTMAKGGGGVASSSASSVRKPVGGGNQDLEQRILELEQLVQQRDNEIAIMVNMIRKEKNGRVGGSMELPESLLQRQMKPIDNNQVEALATKSIGGKSSSATASKPPPPPENTFMATFQVDPAILDDPAKAFDAFKTQYPKNDAIRENKLLLKQKYDAAKDLANVVNEARHKIKHLTVQMEKLRKQQAITEEGLLSQDSPDVKAGSNATLTDTTAENKLKDEIEEHKLVYKKGFHELSELKKEIQHIQKLLEMGRIKLQKDFDLWYQRQGKGTVLTETLLASAQPKVESPVVRRSVETISKTSNQEKPSAKSASPSRPEKRPTTPPSRRPQSPAGDTKKPATPRGSNATTSSVDDDVSGFYEALDILKRRSVRK
ncbi:hypothetical protein Poli38472_010985 [Pythium oligandrum]|uniref:Kinesin-like protein n=1 Tax=Pythium oligandrum TaxID=41045 RepID=A0A8K1FJL0_PYTOL|nr:hypothetical protein Poli38472_010985 [Pythium oligandrum]|eukprot:TMW61922.1 hypothetical protein Poli38472_010985 [Pythium oligandrum]